MYSSVLYTYSRLNLPASYCKRPPDIRIPYTEEYKDLSLVSQEVFLIVVLYAGKLNYPLLLRIILD